jgi:hypothetical protein
MPDDYTYGEFVVDRIEVTVRGGSVPITRNLVLDLTAADQADPEVAVLLAYIRAKYAERAAAANERPSMGGIGLG